LLQYALPFASLCLVLAPGIAAGGVPEISPGECIYLVGAPPGAPAAAEEERNGDGGRFEVCTNPVAGGAANRDGDNMVQAWIMRRVNLNFQPDSCRAFAWVSHDFRVPDTTAGPVPASITMEGFFTGVIDSGEFFIDYDTFDSGARLWIELLERNPETAGLAMVAEAEVFDREIPEGILELQGLFARQVQVTLRPGAVYQVRLHLEVWVDAAGVDNWVMEEVDFGLPGPIGPDTRFARYDSIKVCRVWFSCWTFLAQSGTRDSENSVR